MSIHAPEHSILTMGIAHLVDAFQGGREAAQSARRQLKDGAANLVLAFGRGDVHFQDFIEGVRLVTGEETLVGFPTTQVAAHNLNAPDAAAVLLMQSSQCLISVASIPKNGQANSSALSTLLTQLRKKRGSQTHHFQHRYLIFLDNLTEEMDSTAAREMRYEAGLLTELVAFKPPRLKNIPLMSQDQVVPHGFVAIEFLSNQPWGVGAINIGEFKNQKGVHAEAAKTIVRRAISHMTSKPAGGLLLSNFSSEDFSRKEWESIFQVTEGLAPGLPVVGVETGNIYIHQLEQPISVQKDSLAVILFP
jgi:hypothetical protein